MSLDPRLLEILACPQDKGPLVYSEAENVLVNERKGIAYRIDENVPVLLADEAMEWPNDSQGEN
ncbi:Trm112 family protein [Corynebacterium pseudodiphtheriticum]|uniref:Trm112 family protein n=1 Tax=Corynebacterium pseudodiphtheriticum TaxID=37637 RepID=UPI00234E27EE|nr:Trm112 family protein [Corynebacterium pseudodiphtheriticum]MDC7069119.1 Trm112 family protein [Corynebacterium pseudodiphtheriticum]MDC7085185.1 Trm112 family protein [Corynebacterium pseudodiphtheriticum]MDC7087219.1 Trm112 family protein [Corynebacterium pseudodiphtheriticum]